MMRKNYWRQLDELGAKLILLTWETKRVVQEARVVLAKYPVRLDDFEAYLARRISYWQSYINQLAADLFADLEAEAQDKGGSSSVPEKGGGA